MTTLINLTPNVITIIFSWRNCMYYYSNFGNVALWTVLNVHAQVLKCCQRNQEILRKTLLFLSKSEKYSTVLTCMMTHTHTEVHMHKHTHHQHHRHHHLLLLFFIFSAFYSFTYDFVPFIHCFQLHYMFLF